MPRVELKKKLIIELKEFKSFKLAGILCFSDFVFVWLFQLGCVEKMNLAVR